MKIASNGFTVILLTAVLLSLTGCDKQQYTGESGTASEPVATVSENAVENTYAGNEDVAEKDDATKENSGENADINEENAAENTDINEENTNASEGSSTEAKLSSEEQDAKESYEYWDEYCNRNPLDLTPTEGEFMAINPESEDAFPYMDSPDGDVFGFYDDLTDGCSVWCAIDYESYVNKISASSTLAPQGKYSYDAANLGNRSRKDAWVEGTDGYGIGESVTIVRNYSHGGDAAGFKDRGYDSFFFPALCIVNGMAKDEKSWKNNSRVKSLKLYFNDKYIATLELEDSMKPQFISLSGLHLSAKDGADSTFRFEIADVYPGDKYNDTALTGIEIEVFTENH